VSEITGSEVEKSVDTLSIVSKQRCARCGRVRVYLQNISGPWRDCRFFFDKKLLTLICNFLILGFLKLLFSPPLIYHNSQMINA